jgi:hypothetical protein
MEYVWVLASESVGLALAAILAAIFQVFVISPAAFSLVKAGSGIFTCRLSNELHTTFIAVTTRDCSSPTGLWRRLPSPELREVNRFRAPNAGERDGVALSMRFLAGGGRLR